MRGSREAVRGLVRHVEGLLLQGTRLHSEILEIEDDDEEAERQDSNHLTYITRSSELATAAQVYLRSREEDAESAVGQNVVPILEPPVDPEAQRREQARQEEMTNALQRAQQARERVDQAWHEANEATNALRLLGIANPKEYLQPDEDQLTYVSRRHVPPVKVNQEQQRQINTNNRYPRYPTRGSNYTARVYFCLSSPLIALVQPYQLSWKPLKERPSSGFPGSTCLGRWCTTLLSQLERSWRS